MLYQLSYRPIKSMRDIIYEPFGRVKNIGRGMSDICKQKALRSPQG